MSEINLDDDDDDDDDDDEAPRSTNVTYSLFLNSPKCS